jgi:hypothetical protein
MMGVLFAVALLFTPIKEKKQSRLPKLHLGVHIGPTHAQNRATLKDDAIE